MKFPLPSIVATSLGETLNQELRQSTDEAGGFVIDAASAEEWIHEIDSRFPYLALLDMDRTPGWQDQVRRAKLRPHTRYIPLVAVTEKNSHFLEEARELKVDIVETRERLEPQLATLVYQAIHPPTIYPDGWEQPLPADAMMGLHSFNRREFFEQHEHFENAWRREARPVRDLYQGILQIGVAFYQIERGNWDGAIKTFRRGLPKLRGLPPTCQGIQLAPFLEIAEQIHWDVTALGSSRLAEFDQNRFPKISLE
ncbi:MAG: DUF309 domain-containing protein [Chloroflexota bacterium]